MNKTNKIEVNPMIKKRNEEFLFNNVILLYTKDKLTRAYRFEGHMCNVICVEWYDVHRPGYREMIIWCTSQMTVGWEAIDILSGTKKYKKNLRLFLSDYPEFKRLFFWSDEEKND